MTATTGVTAAAAAEMIAAQVNGMAHIVNHVTTPAGAREVQLRHLDAEDAGDHLLANYLDSCIIIGLQVRATYDAVEKNVRSSATRALRSEEDVAAWPDGTRSRSPR